ncbi:carboxymuconolactone decarboxylase family protein [Sphingobium sp. H39-3-25]|uniref:carboxymuconolactone decarboxylase family protein n=1 Tax=Sphingobium arseniciresistens TaxID=3030834 RepID=UPI0023B8EDC2|nr:carboxymuconolactone decarboxylase family protein [Sphingobium arseniciresistens]
MTIDRLQFDDIAPRLQSLLRARVDRLGYFGEFFQCAAHQPDVLAPFMEMTEALKQALPDRLTELGALTVASLMGNDYERHQHERLSRKLGFSEAWIAAVERVSPEEATELSGDELAVQRLIVAVIERRGKHASDLLDATVAAVGEEQAMAILFLVGRYVTHAMIVNTLALAPPVPSIFALDKTA